MRMFHEIELCQMENVQRQTAGRSDNNNRSQDSSDDFLVRGLMKKHEDHVRVLEALIYNQETLISLKDAKIEELQDNKLQVEHLLGKLQDNQLFYDDQCADWEHERLEYVKEIQQLKDANEKLANELSAQTAQTQKLRNKVVSLKEVVVSLKSESSDAPVSPSSVFSNNSLNNSVSSTYFSSSDCAQNCRPISLGGEQNESQLTQDNERLQQQLDNSLKNVDQLQQLVVSLEQQLVASSTSKQQLDQELGSTRTKNVELADVVAALEAELSVNQQQLAQQQQQIEDLENQLKRCQKDQDDIVLLNRPPPTTETSSQMGELPGAVQRLINMKVEMLKTMKRTHVTDAEQVSTEAAVHRPESSSCDNGVTSSVLPVLEIEGDEAAVYGMAVLDNELFVVRWKRPGIIEVYDVAVDFAPICYLFIQQMAPPTPASHGRLRGLLSKMFRKSTRVQSTPTVPTPDESSLLPARLTDIVSCGVNGCLYVSDLANCCVLRLRPNDATVSHSWPVDGGAYGLSVTDAGDVIVCCTGSRELRQYTAEGAPVRVVPLPEDCVQPWHALEFSQDRLVFCHGGRYWNDDVGRLLDDPLHRVCTIDTQRGQLVDVHGDVPGPASSLVCYPLYLSVLDRSTSTRYLLVADCDNNRIKLLDASLRSLGDVLGPADGLRGPYRLVVIPLLGLIVVGLVDGRLLVYRLQDLGLLPSSATDSAVQLKDENDNFDTESIDVFETPELDL